MINDVRRLADSTPEAMLTTALRQQSPVTG
jgi:hypothetical protein